ncbi:hypothetical protein BCT26_22055 [Vibrio lentus]|uniref:hypothetical protein n=1 Tax=Vibrio lentus TaxID=136468 RepID=UPI000C82D67E|nr:hypothetical protein [Vibrio lentus]PMN72302.1 hypothetical protein BCT26_22055 [Vibrio lentus]
MQTNQSIVIQVNTLDEALNLENTAARNISKYLQNPIEGQENLQSALIRMWRDVHKQAGEVIDNLKVSEKGAV